LGERQVMDIGINLNVLCEVCGEEDVEEAKKGEADYPTSTAAATTVVQRPFLSPTAVCVTFCVRTI